MKILIDGRLIADKETGISRYTEELLEIYIKLFGRENIILLVNINLKKEFNNVYVVKTELYPFNIWHFIKFHKLLKTIEFDAYHSMFYANSFYKLKDKIYITTVHDIMYRVVPNFFKKSNLINKLAMYYYDFIVKRSLSNSDYIISISNTTKQDVWKIFSYDSYLITEGINKLTTDNEILEIDKEVIRSKQYFLYVGNGRPHKNIEFLKNSYLNSNTNKKLIIVGHKGSSFKRKNKEVIYTGYINDNTLKYLYENSSAFVFPSLYEGFGLPILEAINLNTLVLSSSAGALKEFNENNIQYFDPKNQYSLIKLLENIDNIIFDNYKKKKLLAKFNWTVVENQLIEFYNKKGIIK
jgi:glycosyltransferase involved in cell wall biosynthesis